MARIADAELERLKREVSLVRLIEGQGIRLVSQGKDLACRCPWHEGDETPSCIVTPKSNLWHCFGCDAGGTVIDWVMRSHRVSFRHACELLLKEHPALGAAPGNPSESNPGFGAAGRLSQGKLRQAQSFALETDADEAASDQRLLDQVIEFYHQTLLASPEALKYLEGRGLGNRELIERFRLGFANRTLAYRLAPKQYKAGAQMRTALQRIGILRESGHEHLNGSIVVPLWAAPRTGPADGIPADGNRVDSAPSDSSRHVVGAYARKINDNLRVGTPMHLYLPGPHRGVLNGEGLEGQREVILCEAILDALTFWSAGYRNVTSCYGVNGLTDELLASLKACGAERVLIAFDRDDAGDRGAEAVAKRLMAEGLECYRLLFPKGMDANAYACRVLPAEKSLGVVIRSGQWMGRGAKPSKASPTPVTAAAPSVAPQSPPASPTQASEPAVESSPLAAEPHTPGVAEDDKISTAAESAAKKDASPTPIISPEPQPMLPEPEAAAVPAGSVPEPTDHAGCQAGVGRTADEQQLLVAFGERRYRVRGTAEAVGRSAEGERARHVLGRGGADAGGCRRDGSARRYPRPLPSEGACGFCQARVA